MNRTSASDTKRLIQVPPLGEPVIDADEEIFLLYTGLQKFSSRATSSQLRGLGQVDSRRDRLMLAFELRPPEAQPENIKPRVAKKKGEAKLSAMPSKVLEVVLAQDTTAVRTRKGDTGSLLWRASTELAQSILQQHHSKSPAALLDARVLSDAHVLELGAGTGLLSIAIAPLVRHYTVTDMASLLPLIRKNLLLNFPGWPGTGPNVTVAALDWTELHTASPSLRTRLFPLPEPLDSFDLILVVDCIYNPSLVPALLSTLDYIAGSAPVLVVVELRSEDVLREFLEGWLRGGVWNVWRLGDLDDGGLLGMPYVAWVGCKVGPQDRGGYTTLSE